MGRSRGPETSREGAAQSRRMVGTQNWRAVQSWLGWLGPDSRDGRRRTTKDSEMERQGGPRRQTQRQGGRLPSSFFPSQQPGVFLSLGAAEPSAAPPPSQSARLSARCPPASPSASRPGLLPLPRAASLLPLPHFLLLSLCQTHLELFKPKYSAPSPL